MMLESAIVLKVLLWGAIATVVGIWLVMSLLILREIVSRGSRRSRTLPTQNENLGSEGD
jgi:hypothetical protein